MCRVIDNLGCVLLAGTDRRVCIGVGGGRGGGGGGG